MPLKPHLPEGWYLVYWRAISVDGHPVQGAFTFAIGPNQGPAPQFVVPKISQTATTTAAAGRPLGDVPDRDGRDRALRAPDRHRAAGGEARRRVEPAQGLARLRDRVAPRADRDPGVPRHRDLDRLAALGIRGRGARAALPRHGVRSRATSTSRSASRCSALRRGSRSGSTGPGTSSARSRSSGRCLERSSPRRRCS